MRLNLLVTTMSNPNQDQYGYAAYVYTSYEDKAYPTITPHLSLTNALLTIDDYMNESLIESIVVMNTDGDVISTMIKGEHF